MNLKEQLAVKQAEDALKIIEAVNKLIPAEGALQPPTAETLAGVLEAAAPVETPQFRVSGFAFQFKGADWTLKADKMGVYVPQNQEQLDFLIHQVSRGNIVFN